MDTEELNLLVIGDVPGTGGLCGRVSGAGRGYRLQQAGSLEEGLHFCNNNTCGCIVLSYHCFGEAVLAFLEHLQDRIGHLRIPVVVLDAGDTEATAIQVMRLGASDYLVKENLNQDALCKSVQYALAIHQSERERAHTRENLIRSNNLLDAIRYIQSKFILSPNPRALMNELLAMLLSLTSSEFGIIGEVLTDEDGKEYLSTFAVSNIAGNEQTRKLFDKNMESGFKFLNMDNLIGPIIKTGKAFISPAPSNDHIRGAMPDGHPELKSFMVTPIDSGEKLAGFAMIANRDGGYDEELIEFLQPFFAACGNIIEAYRNYQQRIKAEDELRELNTGLEQRIRKEAERRLVQERLLIQQSRMAAMGEMISAIAHQWKQPLNTLALMVQNMEEDLEENKIDRLYVNNVIVESMKLINYMAETVEDFRNFFKPAKDMSPFSLKKAVEDILALIYLQFIKRNIDATVECKGDPMILGYPNEFKQAILNLVNNARDAIMERKRRLKGTMGRGRISIKITEDREDAVVQICDNGGGVREDIVNKIFDPYVTTKGEKGTGIGLYMSRSIVEKNMNGRLEFNNIKDGACFTIYMPLLCALNIAPMS
ncbi:ATP-binding protein [Candidatus Magnetominusculus dajiuhuensis]|uniref:ATP-binding protein n=1 Tax=Candidatus Magnetominusculus dajiuhuensis TaxID=3137712 RepID=UPI003B42F5B1